MAFYLNDVVFNDRTSEELIETLEENQVQLQNMMTSKYIAFFLEEISTWQKRLSMVDQVRMDFVCGQRRSRPRNSVTRLGDLLDFGQLFKDFGNN